MSWGDRIEITRREAIARSAVGLGAAATASLWLPELVRDARAQTGTITNLVPNPRAAGGTTVPWGGFVTGTGSSVQGFSYLTNDGYAPAASCAEYAVTPGLTVGTAAIYPPRTAVGTVNPGDVVWAHVAAKIALANLTYNLWTPPTARCPAAADGIGGRTRSLTTFTPSARNRRPCSASLPGASRPLLITTRHDGSPSPGSLWARTEPTPLAAPG